MATNTPAHHGMFAAVGAIIVLAALDLVGALLARHWADHHSSVALVGGVTVFGLIFVVYGKSLDYAELGTVTIGWVVLLQVGVVLIDRHRNAGPIPLDRWLVIALILVGQAYLMADVR
jgi:multidrug transporter EmrE-like cation transporter